MLSHMVGYALANRKGVGPGHKTKEFSWNTVIFERLCEPITHFFLFLFYFLNYESMITYLQET